MAGRANSLTDRAKAPAGTGGSPTVPANDLRVLLEALSRLGYDVDSVVAAAGLPAIYLNDPDGRLPCETYGALVSCAQRQRFTPNLGLALAQQTPLGAYPLLDYLVLTSETVGAGVRRLANYFRLVASPVVIEVRDAADPVRVLLLGAAAPFSVEYTAVLIVRNLRDETDGRFAAAHVSFKHTPDDRAAFERALGCPLHTSDGWNGVSIPRDAWQLPLRRRDPILRQVLEEQADGVLARLPARRGIAFDVQHALMTRLEGGDTRIERLARELAMSPRTLQRKLANEGASYQDLLDAARREAAVTLLAQPALSAAEVAYMVGYSEPAPFHRAFKRWFGTTPELFRRQPRQA